MNEQTFRDTSDVDIGGPSQKVSFLLGKLFLSVTALEVDHWQSADGGFGLNLTQANCSAALSLKVR